MLGTIPCVHFDSIWVITGPLCGRLARITLSRNLFTSLWRHRATMVSTVAATVLIAVRMRSLADVEGNKVIMSSSCYTTLSTSMEVNNVFWEIMKKSTSVLAVNFSNKRWHLVTMTFENGHLTQMREQYAILSSSSQIQPEPPFRSPRTPKGYDVSGQFAAYRFHTISLQYLFSALWKIRHWLKIYSVLDFHQIWNKMHSE